MSNTSGKNRKNDTLSHSNSKTNQRWSFIQSDLTAALDTWTELEKAEVHLGPDQQELLKIRFIISQLKEKLEQF